MPNQDPRGGTIRVYIDRSKPLPDPSRYHHPPCFDADNNPVYFGSATLVDTVQPCKVTRKGNELICTIPDRLVERIHQGPFNVLPLTDAMELVPTSHGRIPDGYRPVVGGMDARGRALYHAIAWVRGDRIPGRTSEYLGAAAALFDGREHYIYDAHEILCWRDGDEAIGSNTSVSQAQDAPTTLPEQKTMVDEDLAAMHLRVTVADLRGAAPCPAAKDLDGTTPLYFGSAVLPGEVLPGKVVQARTCQVLKNDVVQELSVGFNILSFDARMELVPTSRGAIPEGRRPVEGNHDVKGRKLHHAMLYVVGRRFPGMCAEYLGGAQGVLEGKKYTLETGYDILCWKENTSPTPGSSSGLSHFSYKDDLAGQHLRKPLNGKEALTTAMAQNFGEHMPNDPDNQKWFFTSVLHDGAIIPSWAFPSPQPCMFTHEGTTRMTCTGPYCVLPFLRDRMVLVPAEEGKIPRGAIPVEGGRDKEGRLLYHAIGWVIDGSRRARMMGMAAEHFHGAVIIAWGKVLKTSKDYELLCWKA